MPLIPGFIPDHLDARFVLSSDTTNHCVPDRNIFHRLTIFNKSQVVRSTSGLEFEVEGIGSIQFNGFHLDNVFFVPDLPVALISLSSLIRSAGTMFEFDHRGVVQKHSTLNITASGGIFIVKQEQEPTVVATESNLTEGLVIESLAEQWIVSTTSPYHFSHKSIDQIELDRLLLKNVCFEPKALVNVISVSQLITEGFRVVFKEHASLVFNKDHVVLLQAEWKNGLYICEKVKPRRSFSLSLLRGSVKNNSSDVDTNQSEKSSSSPDHSFIKISPRISFAVSPFPKYRTSQNNSMNVMEFHGALEGLKCEVKRKLQEQNRVIGVIERIYWRRSPYKWAFTVDSTCHATHHKEMLDDYRPFKRSAYVELRSHNQQLRAHGMGTIKFNDLTIRIVLYVPGIGCNIISLPRLLKVHNLSYEIKGDMLTIRKFIDGGPMHEVIYKEAACSDRVWIITWRG